MKCFTLNNSQFTINSHFSFHRLSDAMSFNGKSIIGNSMKIVNCKLIIASEGGCV
ncbi:hypothetical protein BH10PAT3_BH10PAT3_3540 [soil metagenome]